MTEAPAFALLSTSDTDLLSARVERRPTGGWATPPGSAPRGSPQLAAGSDLVVVRILGVRRQYEEMLAPLLAGPAPVVVLGGESVPDAELMELSTVPMGVATEAHGYLAQGGPDNLAQLHRFLADTVLLDRARASSRRRSRRSGACWSARPRRDDGPTVAVLYYRAHHLSGNTAFVEALCTAIEDAGGRALPVFTASLRTVEPEPARRRCAPPTRWSSPCSRPAARSRPPRRPAGTTAPGTSASWRRSTCRSCRGCA